MLTWLKAHKYRILLPLIAMAVIAVVPITGCGNAQFQRTWNTNGRDFQVDVYGLDGKIIKSYVTSGKVQSEDSSGGWYFVDRTDGQLHIIEGGFVDIYPAK
jgi:hypothetical protein